ncbi:MAG: hypothetical protein EBR49_18670 [Betaproteobacteria bacterium]|nr:hypothetical protein [Betaproteobacteria bacterium]
MGDFYVGGHAEDVRNFFAAQVQYSKHSFVNVRPWVHSDLIFRHAYRNLRGKLNLPDDRFFPNITPTLRLDMHPAPRRFKYHPEVLRLWAEILDKSICLYPRDIAARMEWRGSLFALSSHSSGEFYEEWLEARTNPQQWVMAKYPSLYSDASSLSKLERFLNFNVEKAYEIENQRPALRRHFYRLARFLLTLFTGKFPRDEFMIELWLRWNRRRHR